MRFVHAALVASALGCAGAPLPPCGSSLACGGGEVYGLDGRCGAITALEPLGHAAWRAPRSWAATADGAPRAFAQGGDAHVLGGDRRGALWLAFDALREPPERALLVLDAADPDSRRATAELTVRAIDGRELARARVASGAAGPIAIALTVPLGRPIELVVQSDAPIEIATPRHVEPRRRPRLELLLADRSAGDALR